MSPALHAGCADTQCVCVGVLQIFQACHVCQQQPGLFETHGAQIHALLVSLCGVVVVWCHTCHICSVCNVIRPHFIQFTFSAKLCAVDAHI